MQFLKGEENGIIWDSATAPANEIKDETDNAQDNVTASDETSSAEASEAAENTKELGVETFWQDELDESPYYYYFEGDDIYFSLADPDNFEEGDQRISYRGININEDADYTIVGIQKSNYLYRPDDGAGDWIYEGVKTRADLTENSQKSGVMGVIFWGVLALVFLALSLWKFEVFEKLFSKNA